MTLYARLAQTAVRLLNRFGRDATFTRTDFATGNVTTRTQRVAKVGDVKHELPGSAVQIGDFEYFTDASATPRPGELMGEPDGTTRIVVPGVETIRPADTIVAHRFYTRAG